jgi:dienelactone hydrolase
MAGCGVTHRSSGLAPGQIAAAALKVPVSPSTIAPCRRSRSPRPALGPSAPPYAVGERVATFVDHSRTIRFPGHRPQTRPLETVIRYPAVGRPGTVDALAAPIARGRFPLVVFGHGFAVTPFVYRKLLRAWARSGYIVAAPVFPREQEYAPGGPSESDLINQPRDMSFVITQMLCTYANSIAPAEIAVAGQSDGGETALAVAYDRYYLDRRVRAAVILSGAELPGIGGFTFPSPSPPLLASQGTADTINLPVHTYQFFRMAPRPKYLLELLGAHHLPPYTYEQSQLRIVQAVTIAFLDRYLKGQPRGLARMRAEGNVGGLARLSAYP